MDIGSIKSQGMSGAKDSSRIDGKKGNDKDSASKSRLGGSGDKLSISSEGQQLSRVLSRISSGFYNSPEVLNETAQRIEAEINSQMDK